MKLKLTYILTLIVLITGLKSFAQNLPKYLIEPKVQYGYIMSHSPTMRYITRAHFGVYELSLSKQTTGDKVWHHSYKLPSYGLTAMYTTFNKNQFFGNSGGLAGHFNFRIYNSNFFKSVFKLGLGLSYTQNVYDPSKNFKNTALATPINALIILHFNNAFKINQRFDGLLGFGMTHYSNGNFKKPNRGINIFTINTGIRLKYGQTTILKSDSIKNAIKKISYNIRCAAGIKEIYPPQGKKYFANTISISAHLSTSIKNTWGAGLEYFYDSSSLNELNRDSLITTNATIKNRLALYPNYLLFIGNTAIELGWGFYIYDQFKLDGKYYQRVGFRHYFKNNWFCNFSLKTHFANADYIEWGLGYRFY